MHKVLEITNKYISIATPLILYSLLSSVYLAISANGGKLIHLIFAIILFFLMTGAFIAGWFNMIKIAITIPDKENQLSIITDFVSGVGEYFLPSCGLLLISFIIMGLVSFGFYYLGLTTIGSPDITTDSLTKAMQSQEALKTFVASLSVEQLTKLSLWNILILISMIVGYFILFLYPPALFFENKNPIKALWISLKNLLSKQIFRTTFIYLTILILNFILSILSTVLGGNIIVHLILTLLNFYFITAVGIGIFYYYHNNFVNTQIGQNVDVEI